MKRQPMATTPNRLLNALCDHLAVKRDADLARELKLSHSALTRIRNLENDVSSSIILRIYDRAGWGIEHIRTLAGINMTKDAQ